MANRILGASELSASTDGGSARDVVFVDVGDVSPNQRLSTAMARTDPLGVTYPGQPLLVLVDKQARFLKDHTEKVAVEFTFEVPGARRPTQPATPPQQVGDPPIISISAGVTSDQTTVDINGNPIATELNTVDDNGAAQVDRQTHTVQVDRPVMTVTFQRVEDRDPSSLASTLVGHINAEAWNGYESGFWLCRSVDGDSRDNGETYRVRYVFELNLRTWNARVVHEDPATGRPVDLNTVSDPDAVALSVQVYPSASFNGLGLSTGGVSV